MSKEERERHALHRRLVERGVIAAKRSHPATSSWAQLVQSFNEAHDKRATA